MLKPIDNDIRELAVAELDRNLVVTAGAGTGKTTLLVNRILHLLLGHRRFHAEESPVRRIVAMTFTEKAASDIKVRLMGELEKIVAVIKGSISGEEKEKPKNFSLTSAIGIKQRTARLSAVQKNRWKIWTSRLSERYTALLPIFSVCIL